MVKKIIIPRKVFIALAIVEGKVRAQIFNKAFKEEILDDLMRLRKLLKKDDLISSFFIISKISQKIQHRLNLQPALKRHLALVLLDLIAFKNEISKLL